MTNAKNSSGATTVGTTVVLASASPARLDLLRAAGIDPQVVVSGVDENAVQAAHQHADPATIVTELAVAKARAVAAGLAADLAGQPDPTVVIGCDSMLLSEGELVGKPASSDAARAQWARMAGKACDLLTGHAVLLLHGGEIACTASATATTTIRMGTPEPQELEAYLATGEPFNVAGSLTIDGFGGWFVDGIDGDHGCVLGLSLPLTRRLLAEVGIAVTELWRQPPARSTAADEDAAADDDEPS